MNTNKLLPIRTRFAERYSGSTFDGLVWIADLGQGTTGSVRRALAAVDGGDGFEANPIVLDIEDGSDAVSLSLTERQAAHLAAKLHAASVTPAPLPL